MTKLAQVDQQLSRIVELRYFGGLTCPEAAQLMEMPLRSLELACRTARAWLYANMRGADAELKPG